MELVVRDDVELAVNFWEKGNQEDKWYGSF